MSGGFAFEDLFQACLALYGDLQPSRTGYRAAAATLQLPSSVQALSDPSLDL